MRAEVKEVMREGGRDEASAKERGEVEGTGTKRQDEGDTTHEDVPRTTDLVHMRACGGT
jgi:hypothetical protein